MQKGSAQPHVYPKDIMELKTLVNPNNFISNNFLSVIKPQFEIIGKLKLQSQELSSLRDFLLPMLMNGQVEVE